MASRLPPEILTLLEAPDTVKALGTVGPDGVPHVTYKGSLRADGAGNLVFAELIEASTTNRNLTWSIWFRKPVTITLLAADRRSFQIHGLPVKAHVSGPLFEKCYRDLRARLGDVDVSTVWVVEPTGWADETPAVRLAAAERDHPLLKHVDRFVKTSE